MPEESSSFNPYKYEIDTNTQRLIYFFITEHGLKYEVYFFSSTGDFESHPHLDNQTYTFGFGPNIERSVPSTPVVNLSDLRIKDTIIDIIQAVMNADKDIALLYICSAEGRGSSVARHRLFNSWFRQINVIKLFGLDITKYELNAEGTFMSLLVERNNKYFDDFRDAIRLFEQDIKNK